MATKNIYLLDPYADVIKITAVSDSEFKLKINGSIYYTKAEVLAKINAIPSIGDSEDQVSKISRWISSLSANIVNRQFAYVDSGDVLINLNSYSDNICGGVAAFAYQVYCLFYAQHYCLVMYGGATGYGAHQWNAFTDGHFDQVNKCPTYKGKYVMATVAEILADHSLYTEPIKINALIHYSYEQYQAYMHGVYGAVDDGDAQHLEWAELLSTLDDLTMKMPASSSFVFPVKSANDFYNEGGAENTTPHAVMICTFPEGVIGDIEMPFNLLQINGTGTIIFAGIEYDLPTDEADLITRLQKWYDDVLGSSTPNNNFNNKFEIVSNTEGLTCEFLINHKTVLLYHNNSIEYTITSGSLSFERAKAAIPLDTIVLSVNKGLSPSFTINFDKWHTSNKSFKIPVPFVALDQRIITFSKGNDGLQPIPQLLDNASVINSVHSIIAGTPVVDQCFSARLSPNDIVIEGSTVFEFISVDGSDVHYTTNGDTPTVASTKYTVPFTISATTTIKWVNIKADYANSHVNSRVITLNPGCLNNGGFDNTDKWWVGAGAAIADGVVTYGDVNNWVQLIQVTANNAVAIEASTKYKLKFTIGIVSGNASILVSESGATIIYVAQADYANGDHEISFTTPSDIGVKGISFMFFTTSSNPFTFDNVSLRKDLT